MSNPVEAIRLACDTSEYAFALEAQVSRSVVRELEAGLYPDVSQHLSRSLGKLAYDHGVDAMQFIDPYDTLNDAYHAWQHACRVSVDGTSFRTKFDVEADTSPFAQLFADMSTIGFCELIKVPRSPVQRYASGAQITMPESVRRALEDIGYPAIKELEADQMTWNRYR